MPEPMAITSVRTHAPAPALSNSNSNSSSTAPSLPRSVNDGGGEEGLITDLVARGVRSGNAQSLVADHSPDRIVAAIAWFDQQQAGSVGGGVLVAAVREGRTAAPRPASVVDRQREYGDRICSWLNQHFPEFTDQVHGPHPAAIAAVIRLHYLHGKGAITKSVHGKEIRAAVRTFDAKWREPEAVTG